MWRVRRTSPSCWHDDEWNVSRLANDQFRRIETSRSWNWHRSDTSTNISVRVYVRKYLTDTMTITTQVVTNWHLVRDRDTMWDVNWRLTEMCQTARKTFDLTNWHVSRNSSTSVALSVINDAMTTVNVPNKQFHCSYYDGWYISDTRDTLVTLLMTRRRH